jgi:hypothetical protein
MLRRAVGNGKERARVLATLAPPLVAGGHPKSAAVEAATAIQTLGEILDDRARRRSQCA